MDWFWWEIETGKPHDLNGKIDGFRLRFSLKPILWFIISWSHLSQLYIYIYMIWYDMIWYDMMYDVWCMMYDEIADQSVPGHTLVLNLIRSTFQSLSHSHTQSKCVMVSAWPILDSSILEKQTVHSWLAYLPIYSRRFVGRKLPQNPPAGWSSIIVYCFTPPLLILYISWNHLCLLIYSTRFTILAC